MTLTHTRTFSLLAISPAAYREMTHLRRALGPDYASLVVTVTQNQGAPNEEVVIDMHEIALTTHCDHDWDGQPDDPPPYYRSRCGVELEK